jgi:hypothetical protein
LSWFGITGGAITLVGHLDAFMSRADWAAMIVNHWFSALHYIWSGLFAFVDLQFPPELTGALTYTCLIGAIALNGYLKGTSRGR